MSTKAARAAERLRRAAAYFSARDRLTAEECASEQLRENCRAGSALLQEGHPEGALRKFETALKLCPTAAEAWLGAGLAENARGNAARAYEYFAQAVMLTPNFKVAENNLAVLAGVLGLPVRIMTPWDSVPAPSAVARAAHKVKAKFGTRESSEFLSLDPDEATLRAAIADSPRSADLAMQLGRVLLRQGRETEAEAFLRYALGLAPWHERAAIWLCILLERQSRFEEQNEVAHQALEQGAGSDGLLAVALWIKLRVGDWRDLASLRQRVTATLENDPEFVEPYVALHFTEDAQLHLDCARQLFAALTTGCAPLPAPAPGDVGKAKLTIGYVSAEFYEHAVASLFAEVLELHDRGRFQVHGYAIWPTNESKMARRMRAACDRFTSLVGLSDIAQAEKIRADGVDILIDITGFTKNNRLRLIARRPAPIQVNFLGYPGTMGTNVEDYIVVDPTVVSATQKPYFAEALVTLPDTYQPNDRQKWRGPVRKTRADYALPVDGVVFCSFNEQRKILPETFSTWMRILARVPGSVLWLLAAEAETQRRLRAEAQTRGIDPGRLIFAQRLRQEDHLARFAVADLFLDTHPYNAHTTASDALWMGCPVVAMLGANFQSRVAASLLKAAGLPELVTHSPQEYENLAVRIGTDAVLRTTLRAKLAAGRDSCVLFDTPRYVRHLEMAFEEMWRRYCAGEKPAAFDVPPLPASA